MKKIGIFTLNGYYNYGNRLQNYALEQVLLSLDFQPKTIRVFRKSTISSKKNRLIKLFSINQITSKFRFILNKEIMTIRTSRFIQFSNEFLNETETIYKSNNEIEKIVNEFEYFVVGSDQVWNPNNLHGTDYYFLPFSEKVKNIAYSPSFGVTHLPNSVKPKYSVWLNNFSNISVRENTGQDIVKSLIGIIPPILVDPTLLLSSNDWTQIAQPHKNKPNKEYLVTYFLTENKNTSRFINSFARKNNLKIVRLGTIRDRIYYTTNPNEFIDFIKNAKIIFTDSFHGSVFSILFKKPFVVFKRGNMNSRIDTLLSNFKFENRHWDYIKDSNFYFDIDYGHVQAILDFERKKSLNYLTNALCVKKED